MTLNYEIIHGLDFTEEEIAECRKRNGLLSLELEFSKACNLRCIYCYANAGEALENELGLSEIKDVIDQAQDLGAKRIILLGGGEPLLYKDFPAVIEYIHSKGLAQSLFTNGILITKKTAEFLFRRKVAVVIKHNSNSPEVQDMLAGFHGTHEKIQQGLTYLQEAGYPNGSAQLGIQTVVCRQNIKEVPEMWMWARKRNIIPYFEILTNQGRAREHGELTVSNEEIQDVFERLEEIDESIFNHAWKPHPTIASFTCKRHFYSCLVNSQGHIQPCTGIDLFVGNVRQERLKDILKKSPVIQNLRNIYTHIQGACRTCEFTAECYGCRGNAYQQTGNYLASDPACWLNKKIHPVRGSVSLGVHAIHTQPQQPAETQPCTSSSYPPIGKKVHTR